MKIIEPVTSEDVIERFRATHSADESFREGNMRVERLMQLATEELGEPWYRIRLNRKDVLSVVLPWHVGEKGERELVPPEGTTVGEVSRSLSSWSEDYRVTNPVCWEKLSWHSASDFAPLFLSARAIDHHDYHGLSDKHSLTHLDGLHRMVAWSLWKRLPRTRRLEAYVVGLSS